MEETKKYIAALLTQNNIDFSSKGDDVFDDFISEGNNINAVKVIKENQESIMRNWKIKTRIQDIIKQTVSLPNATVNKNYHAKLDFSKLGWNDIIVSDIENLEDIGLFYNAQDQIISGIPKVSGDLKFAFLFKIEGEAESEKLNEKQILLIINPDPKSLWKNIESDINDPYWKKDDITESGYFVDKRFVVSSKRGRSHANNGSFRDDDFAYSNLENGWSVIAVSDGAGSAVFSRKGSQLACNLVIDYFTHHFNCDLLDGFDELLLRYRENSNHEISKEISRFTYDYLSKATWYVHKQLEEFAIKAEKSIKDFHTTLIFVLVKKYSFGYAILTFGVGDCPIGLINKNVDEIILMNWLDVGEFGGGTRFITMPEIFQSDKFSTRFSFKLVEDFSYLILMTDGVYDAKFVVEANLEKISHWKEFLEDLKGKNDEKAKVDFNVENQEISDQLSNWMNFWNPGNHDDRTLAIIY